MALEIKKVDYFNITIDSKAAEAYKLLSGFSDKGIGLLAFKAIPVKQKQAQFTLFPDNLAKMNDIAKKVGIILDGPHSAVLIKSNSDEPGECADIFRKLSLANINDYEACGIADIQDSYGVVLYLKEEDCEKALAVIKA